MVNSKIMQHLWLSTDFLTRRARKYFSTCKTLHKHKMLPLLGHPERLFKWEFTDVPWILVARTLTFSETSVSLFLNILILQNRSNKRPVGKESPNPCWSWIYAQLELKKSITMLMVNAACQCCCCCNLTETRVCEKRYKYLLNSSINIQINTLGPVSWGARSHLARVELLLDFLNVKYSRKKGQPTKDELPVPDT